MMQQTIIFTLVLAVAIAEPLRTVSSNEVATDDFKYEIAPRTDISSVIDIICALIGYKMSAISIATTLITWAVSNFHVIVFGAAAVLGFCKVSGKCNVNYEQYIPYSQIQSYATAENLETAERLLLAAVGNYADKRKREV